MPKMLLVCLMPLFLMSCTKNTPAVNNTPWAKPIILSPCLKNSNTLNPDIDTIESLKGCDVLTPYTARQILLNNL